MGRRGGFQIQPPILSFAQRLPADSKESAARPGLSARSLALSSLNKLSEAVVYYGKALELDPDNETYKANLKVTEQKMKEAPSPVGPRNVAGKERGLQGASWPWVVVPLESGRCWHQRLPREGQEGKVAGRCRSLWHSLGRHDSSQPGRLDALLTPFLSPRRGTRAASTWPASSTTPDS